MANMILPIIDPYSEPYEVWSTRRMTQSEALAHAQARGYFSSTINDQLLEVIESPRQAAEHLIRCGSNTKFSNCLEERIKNAGLSNWRSAMPERTPPALTRYQQHYPSYDKVAVEQAIAALTAYLPVGQVLFHGGMWPDEGAFDFITDRPLSTTLLPSVAIANANWRGKAAAAGELHLMVLTIKDPKVKAFVFNPNGARQGHEYEALLSSRVRLSIEQCVYVRHDYPAGSMEGVVAIPAKVLMVGVSLP